MTVLHPWVLWATLLSVAGLVAAHLLSVTRPPALRLPTARFVPERALAAVSRAARPSDVLLLLLRVVALLLMGAALAGLVPSVARAPVATLLVVDELVDPGTARDAAAEYAPVAVVVHRGVVHEMPVAVSDSAANRAAVVQLLDSLFANRTTVPRATDPSPVSLSSQLLLARREAPSVALGADSLQLVLVSSFVEDDDTDAMAVVRATWPGRVTLVPSGVASDSNPTFSATVDVRGAPDDIVSVAFARASLGASLLGASSRAATAVRVVRDSVRAEDSTFAEAGNVLVQWIARSGDDDTDSVSGAAVVANGLALVAPFARAPRVPADSPRRAVAWWADGTPAITEEVLGRGCVRTVGFAAPVGDLLVGPEARGLLSALAGACGVRGTLGAPRALSTALMTRLEGEGALAGGADLRPDDLRPVPPWTRWLLLGAVLLLVLEMLVRGQPVRGQPVRGRRALDERVGAGAAGAVRAGGMTS